MFGFLNGIASARGSAGHSEKDLGLDIDEEEAATTQASASAATPGSDGPVVVGAFAGFAQSRIFVEKGEDRTTLRALVPSGGFVLGHIPLSQRSSEKHKSFPPENARWFSVHVHRLEAGEEERTLVVGFATASPRRKKTGKKVKVTGFTGRRAIEGLGIDDIDQTQLGTPFGFDTRSLQGDNYVTVVDMPPMVILVVNDVVRAAFKKDRSQLKPLYPVVGVRSICEVDLLHKPVLLSAQALETCRRVVEQGLQDDPESDESEDNHYHTGVRNFFDKSIQKLTGHHEASEEEDAHVGPEVIRVARRRNTPPEKRLREGQGSVPDLGEMEEPSYSSSEPDLDEGEWCTRCQCYFPEAEDGGTPRCPRCHRAPMSQLVGSHSRITSGAHTVKHEKPEFFTDKPATNPNPVPAAVKPREEAKGRMEEANSGLGCS
eukprot:CAMPEP_0204364106 /NCGR_PEP_ID=MMETSP0469-20131031/40877_1 /ASSEMBLY_ACC=CAM_ASM_000384 /TAXON_ID=2969 /ORGANISM="Oxyrrhis marina" /LENGTH=430 /DNA_ID=CAMNT_0051352943 /DNA_START=20 /DNA_END=1309 /DNA_ORIENTATION=-